MTCNNAVATEYGWRDCGIFCGGKYRYCEECESAAFVQDTNSEYKL